MSLMYPNTVLEGQIRVTRKQQKKQQQEIQQEQYII